MISRRQFLRIGMAAGTGLLVPWERIRGGYSSRAFAAIPGGTLNPTEIPKYTMPVVIPPAMPRTSTVIQKGHGPVDFYEIAVRQFQQRILPTGLPMTTVWSYGSVNHPASFNYPAFTIEADFRRPVRVKWINDLKNSSGAFLPHILPTDPTLHWANPPGGIDGRDMRPTFGSTPDPYTGRCRS
jgi:spore coat protein A, manganese oxidase